MENTNIQQDNPLTETSKNIKKILFDKKIRIYNANNHFYISPLFYAWSISDNQKVFDEQNDVLGHYNLFKNTNGNKYVIVSDDSIIDKLSPETMDFDSHAIDIDGIDEFAYNEWKNTIE